MEHGYFFLNNLVIPGAEMDKSSPDHMADPKERQFSKSNSSKGKYLACRHSAIVRYSGNNTEILALAPKDDADHCSTEKGCLLISGSIEVDLKQMRHLSLVPQFHAEDC